MRMDVALVEFGGGSAALVARPGQLGDLAQSVAGLGLDGGRPVLVVVGGAAGLDEADKESVFSLLADAVLPAVLARQAVVVDGGTDSGVMQLLGRARAEVQASFPLVGVAAEKKVILPGDDAEPGERAPLDRNHSHFVLVPGSSWGDESPWLSRAATEIAGNAPSATILINGGEIALQDVAHSLEAQRPVLVITGTGRTADRIAAAIHNDHRDEQATQLASSPLVTAVSWTESPAAVHAALEKLMGPKALQVPLDHARCQTRERDKEGEPVRAFVIRGFGQKYGVDFERVHAELIRPALKDAGVDGGDTTQVIVQAGNIRKDMFRELVVADIVVADVSVHNANVFYELGIRHAARPRSTVLIYAKIDETPFDLKTDRYLKYDPDSPGTSRAALAQVLRETLASRGCRQPDIWVAAGIRAKLLCRPD